MSSAILQFAVASGQPFAPAGPGGAARYRSYIWPDPGNLGQNAGSGSGAIGARNIISGQTGVTGSGFNGGSTSVPAIVNGLAGIQQNMTATTGNGIRFQACIVDLKTSRNTLTPNDDCACYRIWANQAASNGCALTQDQGFFMVHPGGTAQRLIQDLATGFGFFIGQNNVVSWMVRGPNGLVTTNLTSTAGGFDITKHHTYEMILVSATANADAYLIVLIDGIAQTIPPLSRSWGPGTNLPANTTVSAICSFAPETIADTRIAAATLHTQQVGIVYGPTIGSLL